MIEKQNKQQKFLTLSTLDKYLFRVLRTVYNAGGTASYPIGTSDEDLLGQLEETGWVTIRFTGKDFSVTLTPEAQNLMDIASGPFASDVQENKQSKEALDTYELMVLQSAWGNGGNVIYTADDQPNFSQAAASLSLKGMLVATDLGNGAVAYDITDAGLAAIGKGKTIDDSNVKTQKAEWVVLGGIVQKAQKQLHMDTNLAISIFNDASEAGGVEIGNNQARQIAMAMVDMGILRLSGNTFFATGKPFDSSAQSALDDVRDAADVTPRQQDILNYAAHNGTQIVVGPYSSGPYGIGDIGELDEMVNMGLMQRLNPSSGTFVYRLRDWGYSLAKTQNEERDVLGGWAALSGAFKNQKNHIKVVFNGRDITSGDQLSYLDALTIWNNRQPADLYPMALDEMVQYVQRFVTTDPIGLRTYLDSDMMFFGSPEPSTLARAYDAQNKATKEPQSSKMVLGGIIQNVPPVKKADASEKQIDPSELSTTQGIVLIKVQRGLPIAKDTDMPNSLWDAASQLEWLGYITRGASSLVERQYALTPLGQQAYDWINDYGKFD